MLKGKLSGFTLIELLVVIAIIGILAMIVLSSVLEPKKRAMVNSMKTTMSSVKTSFELCTGTGGTIISGTRSAGDIICGGESYVYPPINSKCSNLGYIPSIGAGEGNWLFTTTGTCGGCRLVCDVQGCTIGSEDTPGACNM